MEYIQEAEKILAELIAIEDMAADTYPTDQFAKQVRNLYTALLELKERLNV